MSQYRAIYDLNENGEEGRQAEVAPFLLDTPDDKVLNHPDSQMAGEQNAYRSQWFDQYGNQGWVNFTQELCS